jgi:hypothetical protein
VWGKVVKVKLSLCLSNYAMKAYGGVDVQIHVSLTSALVGGKWSALRPGCFTLGERAHGTNWIGGWVKVPLWLIGNGYVFYAVRVVSKENCLFVIVRTSCF